jgi:hypothetical protein
MKTGISVFGIDGSWSMVRSVCCRIAPFTKTANAGPVPLGPSLEVLKRRR